MPDTSVSTNKSLHVRATGAGSPVVFIHGAGGSGQSYANQFQAFRDQFRCYFPDLPGHGKSPGVSEPGIQTYTAAVAELIQTLNPPVILVGHSMGGAIALELALAHGELVRGMVLSGTGCRLPVSAEILSGLRVEYGATLDRIIRYCFSKSAAAGLLQLARADIGRIAPDIVRADFTACAAFEVCSRVPALRIPVQIVCGSEDRMTRPEFSRELHALIPGSRLEFIPDGSHMIMLEQRAAFNRVILEFLRRRQF